MLTTIKEIIQKDFIRSVRLSCPNCNNSTLTGELHNRNDGSISTVCTTCKAHAVVRLIAKNDGVHVQVAEVKRIVESK